MQSKATHNRRTELITLRASATERKRLAALSNATGRDIAVLVREGVNRICDEEARAHVFR